MGASKLRLCLFAALIILFYGCVTTPKEVPPFYPSNPPEGQVLIYFYYIERFAAANPKVLVDENYIFRLRNGRFVEHFVTPGKYEFRTDTGMIDEPLKIEVKAGETHYIRLDFIQGAFVSRFKFSRIFPEQASEEIKLCAIQPKESPISLNSNQLQASGYELLTSSKIKETISGNSIRFNDGKRRYILFYTSDGQIQGRSVNSENVYNMFTRQWSVSDGNMYCDNIPKKDGMQCDPLYIRGKEIVFKKPDGAPSYRGVLERGNPKKL